MERFCPVALTAASSNRDAPDFVTYPPTPAAQRIFADQGFTARDKAQ